MSTFILTGNGPFTNHGCEAIVRATVPIIQSQFPGATFVSSPCAIDTIRDPEIFSVAGLVDRPFTSAYRKQPLKRAWNKLKVKAGLTPTVPYGKELRTCTAVLAVGGDNFSLDYGRAFSQYQLDTAEYILKQRKPFVIWGATVGPFSAEPDFEQYACGILKRIALITARDPLTVQYLAEQGVRDNVVKVSDPAFVMEASQPELSKELNSLLSEKPVGINFSPLLGRYLGKDAWFQLAVELLRTLDATIDSPIMLIPHVMWTSTDDHLFLEEVKGEVGAFRNPIQVLPRHLNAPELKWCLGQLNAFVGARTHATIGALSQAVPTLSLGYSMKSRGINLDLFNSEKWVLDIKQMTPGNFAERVQELLNSGDQVREHLNAVLPEYKKTAYNGAKALKDIAN
jgi:polysaccharide pyruvyl transferase WcaK-like protein